MKKTVFIASACFLLVACNQSDQQAGNDNASDTASHSAHNGNAPDTGANRAGHSGDMSDQSMMSLMEKNMEQMKNMRSLGSSDKDFASLMKIHHMGAIEMARLQIARGTDSSLKGMAQKMLDEQQKEIQAFDAFLSNTNQNSVATDKESPFFDRVSKEMDDMKMDNGQHSTSTDQQFVQMMIAHHQSGITMADQYLKTGAQDPKLKSIANNIKTDQQKEIQQMQAWLAGHK